MREPDYVLVIPDVPPSLNAFMRKHWAAQKQARMNLYLLLRNAKISEDVPDAVGRRRIRIRVTFPTAARRDPDNYLKVLLDALVSSEALYDDSDRWCTAEMPVLTYRRGVRETRVEIWECEGERDAERG